MVEKYESRRRVQSLFGLAYQLFKSALTVKKETPADLPFEITAMPVENIREQERFLADISQRKNDLVEKMVGVESYDRLGLKVMVLNTIDFLETNLPEDSFSDTRLKRNQESQRIFNRKNNFVGENEVWYEHLYDFTKDLIVFMVKLQNEIEKQIEQAKLTKTQEF